MHTPQCTPRTPLGEGDVLPALDADEILASYPDEHDPPADHGDPRARWLGAQAIVDKLNRHPDGVHPSTRRRMLAHWALQAAMPGIPDIHAGPVDDDWTGPDWPEPVEAEVEPPGVDSMLATARNIARRSGKVCGIPWEQRAAVKMTRATVSGMSSAKLRPYCRRRHIIGAGTPCWECALRIVTADVEHVTEAVAVTDRVERHELQPSERDRFRKAIQRAGGEIIVSIPQEHNGHVVVYTLGGRYAGTRVPRQRLGDSIANDLLALNGGKLAWGGRVRVARKRAAAPTHNPDNWHVDHRLANVDDAWWTAVAVDMGAVYVPWHDRGKAGIDIREYELHFRDREHYEAAVTAALSPAPEPDGVLL